MKVDKKKKPFISARVAVKHTIKQCHRLPVYHTPEYASLCRVYQVIYHFEQNYGFHCLNLQQT